MKVKDIKIKRDRLYKECKDLGKLEHLFEEDVELRTEVEVLSGCDLNLSELIAEVRLSHYNLLAEIDEKIDNAEIQD